MFKYVILPLVGVMLVYSGARMLWAARSSEPRTMSCAEFVARPSSEDWLQLTGCRLDLENAVSSSSRLNKEKIKELFVPVIPAAQESGTTPAIILQSKNPSLLNAVNAFAHAAEKGDVVPDVEEGIGSWLGERTVSGLVEMEGKTAGKARELLSVGDSVPMLKDGEKPTSGSGLGMIACGLGILGFYAFRLRKIFAARSPDAFAEETAPGLEAPLAEVAKGPEEEPQRRTSGS